MFSMLMMAKSFLNPKMIMIIVISTAIFGFGYKFGSSMAENNAQDKINEQRIICEEKLNFDTKKYDLKVKEIQTLKDLIHNETRKANIEKERLQEINRKVSIKLATAISKGKTELEYIKLKNKKIKEQLNDAENKILDTKLNPNYVNWLFSK